MWSDSAQDYLAEQKRRTRRIVGALGTVVVLGGGWLVAGDAIQDWARYGLPRLLSGSIGEPDLYRIHAETLPTWMIALDRDPTQAQAELLAALGGDAELTALAKELTHLAHTDPWDQGERLIALCADWTRTLDQRGEPWLLECNVRSDGTNAVFYTKSYRVLEDTTATYDDAAYRVRLLERVDDTNIVEGFLGHAGTPEDGARLVVDRTVAATVQDVWPLFDPDSTHPFAHAVVSEAARALDEDAVLALQESAPHRVQLDAATAGVNGRTSCSNYWLRPADWQGYTVETVVDLEQAAAAGSPGCPTVAPDELSAIRNASRALRGQRGLQDALEQLAAHLAHSVVLHEGRHLADHVHGLDVDAPLDEAALAEASAYLATFQHPDVGLISLHQACAANLQMGGGPHYRALEWLISNGLPNCMEPPSDLQAIATVMERELFDRHQPGHAPPLSPLPVQ
jgi:hypothetical protein